MGDGHHLYPIWQHDEVPLHHHGPIQQKDYRLQDLRAPTDASRHGYVKDGAGESGPPRRGHHPF